MSAIAVPTPIRVEEELEQMTYQVVAFGTDGLIVGSDRKVFSKPPSPYGDHSYLQFDSLSKFVRAEDDSIICACAGSQESRRIANEIVSEAEIKQTSAQWEQFLWRKCRQQIMGMPEVIVIRTQKQDAYWVVIGPDGHVSPIGDKQCVGARSSACFLATHFYRRVRIAQLKTFVVLILDCAARELPNWIGNGYDIVSIKTGRQPKWERIEADSDYLLSVHKDFTRLTIQGLYPE